MNKKQILAMPLPPKAKAGGVDLLKKAKGKKATHVQEVKEDGWRYRCAFSSELKRPLFTGARKTKKGITESGKNVSYLYPDGYRSEKTLLRNRARVQPHIQWSKLGITIVDGEILAPHGYPATEVAGYMNTSPEKAARKAQDLGKARYVVFDILFHNGVDVRMQPYEYRRKLLEYVVARYWAVNKYVTVVNYADFDSVVKQGGEGVILKDKTTPYGVGWFKVKKSDEIDCVVTGFKPGTNKYKGQVGALLVSVYNDKGKLQEVGAVSGFTDAMRRKFTKKVPIGSVLSVKCQEMAKNRLRHPRYGSLREDKDPQECTHKAMMRVLKKGKA